MNNSTSSSNNQKNKYEEAIAEAQKNENKTPSLTENPKHQKSEELFYDNAAKEYDKFKNIKILFKKVEELPELINQRYKRNTNLRSKCAFWMILYLYLFSLSCFAIIFLQAFHYRGFNLDKIAITTLIGGFAASVIGLVQIILRGLFLSEEKSINQQIKNSNKKDKS
ncbi:hypothetical protein [Commensalibacter papalotli (ex Servin-Garciduenas et al. 2014)]|uniref:Uncharacterized protein n=1 Tax=Commensalibacter papalotli (ex Servin-Garciduenas et al. 2014) TaxID=1208583 RepID=W7E896_9PROT|nr:hypothetical protein [Commensalibacter papalotli (ex Servin-Garciduenas et al. 2014)]EUK19371.1 hypothetical protein COMX_06455 [Commensalibacter papalotli (ex Servin-Garciduenas et al. 2014)]